jgi:type II secretory pathway pseudopilin PulG
MYRRPGIVTLLAVLHFISGPISILVGLIVAFAGISETDTTARSLVTGLGVIYAAIGAVSLACGVGLWNLKSYGRRIQLVLSYIGLLGIPIGTVISILILVYFSKAGVKVLFSEIPPTRLSPGDAAELARLQQSSGAVVAIVAVVVVLAAVAFIGIIAAIAVPSLLRARISANEAAAIGDVRSVISAQIAYSSSNGGNFDQLECLVKPAECIPGYPANGPSFLLEALPALKLGYERELILGMPVDRSDVAFANLSPTSAESFAYIVYPVTAGTTGVRSFCGDYTGRICFYMDGSRPEVVGGQCDPSCAALP